MKSPLRLRRRPPLRLVGAVLVVLAANPALASAPWIIEASDGSASLKFGFLAQARAESLDTADGSDRSQDLYFRRLRLLAGGEVFDRWSFFFETDSPNLGKGNSDGSKGDDDIYIQDFVVTYEHSDEVKIDGGLLLVPVSRNSTQSAAALLPVDYGPYSFLASAPTDSRVGRDYGVLVRGLLAGRLEYRAALFRGRRGEDSTNDFRFAGRLAYNVFEPDAGLFYSGTTLGKRRILTFGASIDAQEEYRAYAFDAFWDQPVGSGNAVTFQADHIRYDGDEFFPNLPRQDVLYAEAGFYFGRLKVSVFGAYGEREFEDAPAPDESRFELGIGWYPAGYERVLKVSYGRIEPDGAPERDRVVVQLQIFHF